MRIGISISMVQLSAAVEVEYVLFIPSGSDSLITSGGDTFKVREA